MSNATVPGEVCITSSAPTASGGPIQGADLSSEAIRHEILTSLTWALLKAKNATKTDRYRADLTEQMTLAGLSSYQVDAKTTLRMVDGACVVIVTPTVQEDAEEFRGLNAAIADGMRQLNEVGNRLLDGLHVSRRYTTLRFSTDRAAWYGKRGSHLPPSARRALRFLNGVSDA